MHLAMTDQLQLSLSPPQTQTPTKAHNDKVNNRVTLFEAEVDASSRHAN
jgi:hypothetical protein